MERGEDESNDNVFAFAPAAVRLLIRWRLARSASRLTRTENSFTHELAQRSKSASKQHSRSGQDAGRSASNDSSSLERRAGHGSLAVRANSRSFIGDEFEMSRDIETEDKHDIRCAEILTQDPRLVREGALYDIHERRRDITSSIDQRGDSPLLGHRPPVRRDLAHDYGQRVLAKSHPLHGKRPSTCT